ncbi:MAG: sodium:solute symporter family protein [Oscillospiraceae bacterium]|nr:sodium:solute symporter family protein [Oscillospiraceae bacterium]
MTASHYLGAGIVLLLTAALGVSSGRRVKSAGDFISGGRRAGAGIVAGSVLGSLVGGASTIGTAQLAFTSGFSAWWFTLGGGLGCLMMACFFAGPLHSRGASTLPQIIAGEYGRAAATAAAFATSIGNFLTVAAQTLAGAALITAISGIPPLPAVIIISVLMLVYVVFGGAWGAGLVGLGKTALIYIGVGACGLIALSLAGGPAGLSGALPREQFFNLFAGGVSTNIGGGLSLILGVLTTQSYIQAVISARSAKQSRAGMFICAAAVPIIGLMSIFIGMYMRLNYPDAPSAAALPLFITETLPPVAAGAVLAALLIALTGTGAGISLGLSSVLTVDLYKVYINPKADDRRMLTVSRLVIALILALSAALASCGLGAAVLNWSYLAMGLRGAVGFLPLCAALFLRGRVPPRYVTASVLAAPCAMIAGNALLPSSVDPLFAGVLCSLVIMLAGLLAGRAPPHI